MFRNLRLRREPPKVELLPGMLSSEQLANDSERPISILQINNLPENTRRRIYRGLLPASIFTLFKIDLISWQAARDAYRVTLVAEPGSGLVRISISSSADPGNDHISLELQDNSFSGIDLNLLVLNDPAGPRFGVDRDEQGEPTYFGTVRRNPGEEARAMQAGLAPGQVRPGLRLSKDVFNQLEGFLAVLGHKAYFLEPLTYASAWVFEKRGFAYVRGHKLMDDIHKSFQEGGVLRAGLDGSTPFRQPDQWQTVCGRAWAIHDGILETIGQRWDKLRMVKQIGRHAGVETFPEAVYL